MKQLGIHHNRQAAKAAALEQTAVAQSAWLFTLSDLLFVLLAFFVLVFSSLIGQRSVATQSPANDPARSGAEPVVSSVSNEKGARALKEIARSFSAITFRKPSTDTQPPIATVDTNALYREKDYPEIQASDRPRPGVQRWFFRSSVLFQGDEPFLSARARTTLETTLSKISRDTILSLELYPSSSTPQTIDALPLRISRLETLKSVLSDFTSSPISARAFLTADLNDPVVSVDNDVIVLTASEVQP